MKTRDLVKELLKSGFFENKDAEPSMGAVLDGIVSKISLREILSMKNNLVDDNFKVIMQDEDMVNCIEEFFKYNLNVAETSRNSYLHRNTLLYRIDKVLNLTGFNLKNFDDAVVFKILVQVYRLTT